MTGIEALQIALIVLKLTGTISWSWWLVLLPTLLYLLVVLLLVVGHFVLSRR